MSITYLCNLNLFNFYKTLIPVYFGLFLSSKNSDTYRFEFVYNTVVAFTFFQLSHIHNSFKTTMTFLTSRIGDSRHKGLTSNVKYRPIWYGWTDLVHTPRVLWPFVSSMPRGPLGITSSFATLVGLQRPSFTHWYTKCRLTHTQQT